jgi:hypothetical protein
MSEATIEAEAKAAQALAEEAQQEAGEAQGTADTALALAEVPVTQSGVQLAALESTYLGAVESDRVASLAGNSNHY